MSESYPPKQLKVTLPFGTFGIGILLLGALSGYILAPKDAAPIAKPAPPITINVRVEKPEQVKPTLEALTRALPRLEERK